MIPYYDVDNSYEKINNWFKEVYGFTLTKKQAMEFSVHTVSIITQRVKDYGATLFLRALKSRGIKVSEDAFKKYKMWVDKHKELPSYYIGTILMYQRANTLPNIKQIKMPEPVIAKKKQSGKADKDKFIRRFRPASLISQNEDDT